jgi:hypothetical protein
MAHTRHTSTQEYEEFESKLDYTVSSKQAWATLQDPVSKNNNNNNNNSMLTLTERSYNQCLH